MMRKGGDAAELADIDGHANVQIGQPFVAELPMEAFNLANIAQSNFKVLLDNQATTHCFSERALLCSVRGGPAHMRIKTNGGTVVTKTIGTFDQLELTDEVWHLPTGIANILSHSKLCNQRVLPGGKDSAQQATPKAAGISLTWPPDAGSPAAAGRCCQPLRTS